MVGVGGYALLTQDTPGDSGTAEAGDEFGAAVFRLAEGTLWIGVPGEDLGEAIDAGMAVAVSYSYESIQNLNFGVTQNTYGFAGSAEGPATGSGRRSPASCPTTRTRTSSSTRSWWASQVGTSGLSGTPAW
ncbi:hypothetical protein ABN034_17635 [Actinopolymorpha sp. B11F2]|uniref:hypothetical protein n=1 Tax=Actinopolymorpha sp. B11F2 TaxID=3160862 RepID=UPI0032E507C4